MEIGVSSACLYPLETEKAVYELSSRGIKNMEIFVNAAEELEGDIYKEILSYINSYGINVTSLHPFSSPMETVFLFSDYKRRVDSLVDSYRRYFERMAEIGAKIFVLHGALQSAKISNERYFERYLMLQRIAREFGVTVAQENICYCKSKSTEFLRSMSQTLGDEVRFVLDLKQARRSGLNPFELIDVMGDKIAHVHISDGNEKRDCMPIGAGEFDFTRLFSRLAELNYDGAMIVELYRENYNSYDDLKKSADNLTKLYNLWKNNN